jgi:hypothetical protein
MKTQKIKTTNGYDAVIIDDRYTVVLKENGFLFFDNVNNGTPCEDQTGIQPFIDAFIEWQNKREEKRIAEIEAKRIAEEKRINELKDRILKCGTPAELAEEFNFQLIETAKHWSDLFEGRSSYAIKITSLVEYEIMQLTKELHSIEGEWGELCRRDGEHHSTFKYHYDLESYQKALHDHFNGNDFFYHSQETEAEEMLRQIKEDAESMEDIREIFKKYDELKSGYYDCNGNLEMLESDLESESLTGYRYDVYSYDFGFRFFNKYSFNQE